ncbi:hypothetical protein BRADI_1g68462v3 [Brachypodium distachyon]|uniref:Endonuclease/exonuclease/phosphatase domain-containing protein n=1 Tax=Brachypodium distachyon TaxID=15368 RepID=A0A2K2DU02_BRADI|nr:hypothetical protein BRADI_1g68462v3 [Brachypodium distachyon]
MQYIIWNVRGLNDPKKVKRVSELLRVHHLDVIALSETKKVDFSSSCLEALANFRDFAWKHLPAVGTAGGILLRINLDIFDVIRWDIGNFFVSCEIKNKNDGFAWKFVAIYGPAYDELKQQFIDELTSLCSSCSLPILVGGDFNLIRQA